MDILNIINTQAKYNGLASAKAVIMPWGDWVTLSEILNTAEVNAVIATNINGKAIITERP